MNFLLPARVASRPLRAYPARRVDSQGATVDHKTAGVGPCESTEDRLK